MDNGKESGDYHRMGRRSSHNDYTKAGIYHITIKVNGELWQPLGKVVGNINAPVDGADAPRVELSAVGKMVEYELTHSITKNYPVIEIQDYVIMPDHLHAILVVHNSIISKNGRETHLGQVIAGFKKGCNRRYWEWMEQRGEPAGATRRGEPTGATMRGEGAGATMRGEGADATGRGKPADAAKRGESADATGRGEPADATGRGEPADAAKRGEGAGEMAAILRKAVRPPGSKTPSWGSTGRTVLFSPGYVDVMPIKDGQLEQQRQYIHNNPRSRLLRITNRGWLFPQRGGLNTALSLPALKSYLIREHALTESDTQIWQNIQQRLLMNGTYVDSDSYGNRQLLSQRLLPVVCHRNDLRLYDKHKEACLTAAADGAVLVSARIARGEQDIIDEAISRGYPVILIADNGFPAIYHPSERRIALCADGQLLIVTPWKYNYRRVDETISVAECKTMNCIAQALCRLKDDWWK